MQVVITMVSILVLLCLSWFGHSAGSQVFYELKDAKIHFENFIQKYGRNYDSNENQARFEIFKDNLVKINNLNEQSKYAVFDMNQFADITLEELNKKHMGFKNVTDNPADCKRVTDADIIYDDAPESFDWREHNAVTPVKNQYQCLSCYAFSATGNIEGQYAIKHNRLVELSEQQILDCDTLNKDCNGGNPKSAFISLLINSGYIMAEADYPYVGRKEDCKFDAKKDLVQLTDCITYDLISQEKVKQIVYHVGPISINVKADSILYYKKGIIDDEICNHGQINHSVLLVGYGEENGVRYWIVKNSWGGLHGENGYFRMHRGENRHSCAMLSTSLVSSVVA